MQLAEETTDAAPLTWHRSKEREMLKHVHDWLKENPDNDLDSIAEYATRTIMERISANHDNANLSAYATEVRYDTVLASIVRSKDLVEGTKEFKRVRSALDVVWSATVSDFNKKFAKKATPRPTS